MTDDEHRAAIERGRADAHAGRTTDHDTFMAELDAAIASAMIDYQSGGADLVPHEDVERRARAKRPRHRRKH